MEYRLLGNSGLRVSELFLGTMAYGYPDGGLTEADARRVLDRYADAGGNVIDTANFYGDGNSERVVGELLAGRRERFVLATKYTVTRDATDPNAAGNHRKNLVPSLEESLRRLRTDYIDVYWVHIWDRHTPLAETMRALDDAVRAGKVRYIGISDAPAWIVAQANTLADWRGWTPFAGLQAPYSLLRRDIERELLPMAEAFGLTVAAWGPLGHGALARPPVPAGAASPDDPESPVTVVVREVAGELGASPAQVALAWTRTRSRAVHPLTGPRTVEELDDTLSALDLTLPADAIERLETATGFAPGFPTDFITEVEPSVFGDMSGRVLAR
ncbi:aldo/keto reductase [Actinomadura rugatobispora]|uniref:Aldo/keto reductase n=1 Tax=Actinomadura rugatobispora TaxID=1994 RepID=A0ABW1ACL9_9ACTN|nr:aldo/keto reductase [Actinomadura rugatobispora]